jgi:2'-5' RNA ligase
MDTLRAFIALEMPSLVKDIVRESQETLQRAGIHLRWVRPENVHLTLRFLGDITTDTAHGLRAVLGSLAEETPAFFLKIKGAGVFPGAARPRVLWLGLAGETDLLEGMYRRLSMLLSRQGVPEEKRPFRGHLTIGRAKGRLNADIVRTQLVEMNKTVSAPFSADRIGLFKSDLTAGGAVYTPLFQVRSGQASSEGDAVKG